MHAKLYIFLILLALSLGRTSAQSEATDCPTTVVKGQHGEEMSLTLLTPTYVYGAGPLRLEAQLSSLTPSALHDFTACCSLGGTVYRQTFSPSSAQQILSFSFEHLQPFTYGQPIACEVWIEQEGTISEKCLRTVIPLSFKPQRRTVVEEITGMWCPFCSTGTLAMDSLAIRYPDEFIGIALHSRDPLQQSNYVQSLPFPSLPSACFNRKYMEGRPMGTTEVGQTAYFVLGNGGWGTKFEQYQAEPTVADLEVTAERSGQTIQVRTRTRFAVTDADAAYQIALVAVEDQVYDERFYQYNNLSGTGIKAGGYEELPYVIEAPEFNHVGHAIYNSLNGFVGSLPSQVTAGEVYAFDTQLQVPQSVYDPAHLRMVALLIDTRTGEIVNANQTPLLSESRVTLLPLDDEMSLDYQVLPHEVQIRSVLQADSPVTFGLYTLDGKTISRHQVVPTARVASVVLPLQGFSGFCLLSMQQGNRSIVRKIQVR